MKKISKYMKIVFSKRILAILLAFCLTAGAVPAVGIEGIGSLVVEAAEGLSIDNGYIKVTVSEKNGGYGIRTVTGDKVNKDDDDKKLLFEYDGDNTSFTSFQVTRNGETKEYIFGGTYDGSSDVKVSKVNEELVAEWSVADLTFTQTISLVNSGSNEHGTAFVSYSVKNTGEAAEIKCRMLMDTCLGEQDYAYYNIGDSIKLVERETTLEENGYNKTFYAFDNQDYPSIVAYTINASIDNEECKPYKTTFAHWNSLASTVFEYAANSNLTFTNPYNKNYQTADSAFALYFDMGEVAKNGSAVIGTNYGIFSNESVEAEATVAINMVAPDVLEFATDPNGKEDQSKYENDGKFSVKTYIENFGGGNYEKVRVLVYTTGGVDPLNQSGEPTNSTYDNPYFIEISDFAADEKIEYEWSFVMEPKEVGQYAKILYKVYDVSAGATQNSGAIMQKNLIGEAETYVLCPGSVEKVPAVKFTGISPDTVYYAGVRTLYVTGDNFSMLANTSEYKLLLSRADGKAFNGKQSVEIPAENIEIDTTANKMTILLTEEAPGELPEGKYTLTIDYTDSSKEDITAPALSFQVSKSLKYRNDTYGYLAVVKTDDNNYYVKNYASEEAYLDDIDEISGSISRDDILLEFKGSFIKEKAKEGQTAVVYKGLSQNKSDNIMTLNDCLDIKNGTVTITEDNGSVKVDFDAELYTTGAGTSVWSGVCALTELEAGTEYALIVYDENGERTGDEYGSETIALLWPSVGQGFQDVMGLLFEFKYGEFGVIDNEESNLYDQRVIAFGAALDLSFIIPDSIGVTTTTTETDNTWSAVMQQSIDYGPETIRAVNRQHKYNTSTVNTSATTHTEVNANSNFTETETAMGDDAEAGDGDTKSASVQIDDILYGGDYLGINMAIALGVPGYIEGMPGMQVLLNVNTIGDWAFGASGAMEFLSFGMDAGIQFKSKDGVPIPDDLSFYIGGFVPGLNVDGWGILWLQGGGGGISNLYDTIFLESGIPPLRLLIEAQVSLLQVISAKASLGLSLSDIEASISNGRITGVNAPVLDNATVSMQWYPEFFLAGSVNVSILDAIIGGGYMVVEQDGFFEFFIRAALQVPGSVPIVGGITIADANLGANLEKIWGQVVALGTSVGVTYFWGGDIDWLSGSPVYPTYPELVGMEGGFALAAYPVGVNAETGETLYVGVGTNLTRTASTMAVTAEGDNLTMLTTGSDEHTDELYTDVSATSHSVTMYENGCSKFLVIEWEAESEEVARQQADLITIKDNNNNPYTLVIMDNTKSAEEQTDANANLTYDATDKKASLAISFTNASAFNKVWNISTPVAAALVLYDVAPLPALSEENTSMTVSGTTATVTLQGDGLSEFTKLSFIATNKETKEETLIYYKEQETGFADGETVTFAMPESLGSGTYEVSIIARDDNATYYSEATKEFTFTNPNQPAAPTIASVSGAGDYKLDVAMNTGSAAEAFDGYAFSAYALNAESGEYEAVAGVENVLYYKDGSKLSYNEDGTIATSTGNATSEPFTIGGHYESEYTDEETGETHTLVAGFSEGDYTLEVRRFKIVDGGKSLLYSKAATQTVNVKKPVKTEVTVSTVLPDGSASKEMTLTLGNGDTYEQDFYSSSELSLVLSSAAEKVKGRWELDGGTREGTSGEITELTQRTSLYFANLDEGTHTLEFVGENEYGDSTAVKYRFTVDTQGPRLMLSEPLNGSLFDYKTGVVTISGITDKDALLTVIDNDTQKVVIENVPMSTDTSAQTDAILIAADGGFTTNITLDTSVLNHNLTIRVTDALGNATDKEVLVVSDGLGSIEKLLIYAGDEDVTNTKLAAGSKYTLKLFAKLEEQDAVVELNNPALIDWTQTLVEGEAELNVGASTAVLDASDNAEGMVTARFLINDAGAYSVSAAFGDTGEQIISLDSQYTQVSVSDQYYTGNEVTPAVEVWYKGTLLVEGVDYEVTYANNVNVSTDATEKPQVIITGINGYKDSFIAEFEIVYLPMPAGSPYFTVSGVEGNNDYYTSDVNIVPEDGYEVVTSLTAKATGSLVITEEQNNVVTFWMRRLSDGALTDKVVLEINIDKSIPTGAITLDERSWDTFLSKITFGLYKVKNYTATVAADDNYSGVETIEYVVSETAYASVTELEAAGLNWNTYSDTFKPSINENKNQIIYVRITDKAGNVGYISSEGIHADTIAPVVSDVFIKTDAGLTSSSLAFSFTSSEAGTYYYAVMKASETAPDAASIKAGTVANAVMGSGTISPAMSGKAVVVGVSGLQANTMYVVYVVVEDNVINLSDGTVAANVSEVASSEPVSTKRPTAPVEVPKGETAVSPKTTDAMPVFVLLILLLAVYAAFVGREFYYKKRKAWK